MNPTHKLQLNIALSLYEQLIYTAKLQMKARNYLQFSLLPAFLHVSLTVAS